MNRHVTIGTAGHIDHGKTALVRALTGTDTDRLAEEKRRGITIDLGFAHLTLPGGTRASIVDVPGHEDFIRNMVAGAAGIDIALLVVAADEGVMPQTREHLDVLRMLDVRAAVVALTKCDAVDAEWLELAEDDLRSHLAGTTYSRAPIVAVSARNRTGLDRLADALEAAADDARHASGIDWLRMPIDRSFTMHGTGTVVTGTVRDGVLENGAELRVLPAGRSVRVRGLQHHGDAITTAGRGMRAAAALAGIEKEAATRGSWLVSADWPLTSMMTVDIELVGDGRWHLRQRQRVRLHIGTAEVMARVILLDTTRLGPGERALAQLRLEEPVVARYGDRFVVRSYSPMTTIGGGRVIEAIAPKRRRIDAQRAALLAALRDDAVRAFPLALDAAGFDGIPSAELPIRFGPASSDLPLRELVRIGGTAISPPHFDRLAESIVATLQAAHADHPLRPGVDRGEVRRAARDAPPEIVDAALDALTRAGRLRSAGGLLALSDFVPRADPDQAAALERLERAYLEAGLAPPRADELPESLASRPDLRDLLRSLESDGVLVPFPPDRLLHRDALEAARALLEGLAGEQHLGPGDFRSRFDLPRKHLIPLLELFDRLGWTLRSGDLRSVAHKSAGAGQPVP